MAGTVQGTLCNFIHLDVAAALGSRYNGHPQLIDWETEAQIIVLGSSRARFKPKLSDLLPQLPLTREISSVCITRKCHRKQALGDEGFDIDFH